MCIEVLLSCMNQNDNEIIHRSNLDNVKTLFVNQCKVERDSIIRFGDKLRRIDTPTRGLSRSRNMAIENAEGEICLLSDDDEVFIDDLEVRIIETYRNIPKADVIIFKVINVNKRLKNKIHKMKKLECLRVSSQQITFRKESVFGKIKFDEYLGAGTSNGAGEENKFLLDCYKQGLQIYYVPLIIATVEKDSSSTWFWGYDAQFFFNHGKTTRYILGLPMAVLYGLYFLVLKHKVYKKDISFFKAFKYLFKGIRAKCITEKL